MKIIYLLRIIRERIKNKNINSILFADSYGGIHHFFFILEKLIRKKEKFLIICANEEIYDFVKNIGKIKNLKIDVYFYNYKNNLLLSFIKILPLLLLSPLFPSIKKFYTYKLTVDPIRFLIINLFFDKNTQIIIRDQFIKFYSSKNPKLLKKLILNIINLVSSVKLYLYYHIDLNGGFFPSISNYYNKKIYYNYTWRNINNFFFEEKKSKIKKSVIILDDTIKLIDDLGHIRFHEDKKLLSLVINNFILDKKIKNIYLKDHPTSKRLNYLGKLVKNKKVIKIKKKIPLELYIENFEYCIFSNTSTFYFKKDIKLFNISKILKFGEKNNKKNYFRLLKKSSKHNYDKINFF